MTRVGIAGYGYWGQLLTSRMMALPMASVAVIVDQDADKRKKAELLPHVVVGRSLDDLLQHDLDALVVATPASTHETIVGSALAEGMHVFCEKPLALSSRGSAKLVHSAEQRRRVLHVDHTFLFTQEFKYIAAIFQSDPIRSYCSHRMNVLPVREDVSIIEDLAIHDLAMLDAFTSDEPEEIFVSAANWPSPDSAIVTMKLFHGCTASINIGWRQPSKYRQLTVAGEHASVAWLDSVLSVHRHGTGDAVLPTFDHGHQDAVSNALLGFLQCIETSTLVNTDAKRACRIALTIERILASIPT
jgi:predicted dehydrogenase